MADDTVSAGAGDTEMEAAVEAAKQSLSEFLEAFKQPQPGQESFLVRVVFVGGDQMENVWVSDLDFSEQPLHGTVAGKPRLPGLEFMQRVEFTLPQITDWMYVDGGQLVGGFTTRVIRDRLSADKREKLDAEAPYTF